MPRVTISIDERDHVAMKLLSIQKGVKMVTLLDDAIKSYLQHAGAYKLQITSDSDA